MSRVSWTSLVLLASLFVPFLGCGNDGPLNPAPGTVVVTGTVIEVRDDTPVDGGVTIMVETSRQETERLIFPSLFTEPPPSQQTIALYDLVRRVEVGDLVRAEGKRTAAGVELESLAILGGQP